ncbi:MAG: 1-acyl-sn-glycerol-3-phosphate acyltransferase [Alphaproteobacteria bacterium]|nr:1-acyl-sn-glycerol-3-phosphate acyltransferase [Alphaproteobacteria bacterium]
MDRRSLIVGSARFLVGMFFRRVEIVGAQNIPEQGGGLMVSWHPNGLIDPGLIFTFSPRQVIFGARHGLFGWPGLGQVLRATGTVPIYRAMDTRGLSEEERRDANQRSLDALATELASSSFSCLFPEGDSHDSPHPTRVRTGAARLYYRARQLRPEGAPEPVILPVGLFYDAKRVFRSNALIVFHPPMRIPEALDVTPALDEDEAVGEARVRALSAEIARVLHEVVHATEDWELHYLIHRARKLVRAERAHRAGAALRKPKMEERILGFARIRAGYMARLETHPEVVAAIRQRVDDYDEDLRALGVEDHDLDGSPRLVSPWLVLILVLQFITLFLLLPPILFVGYLVNAPPAALLWVIAKLGSKKKKDEATVKLLLGALLFPMCWTLAAVAAGLAHQALHAQYPSIPDTPIAAGLLVFGLSALGAAVAVRYMRVTRETLRAVKVRLTRQRAKVALAALRVERSELHDAIIGMAQGLDLPGEVSPDGRVVAGDDDFNTEDEVLREAALKLGVRPLGAEIGEEE